MWKLGVVAVAALLIGGPAYAKTLIHYETGEVGPACAPPEFGGECFNNFFDIGATDPWELQGPSGKPPILGHGSYEYVFLIDKTQVTSLGLTVTEFAWGLEFLPPNGALGFDERLLYFGPDPGLQETAYGFRGLINVDPPYDTRDGNGIGLVGGINKGLVVNIEVPETARLTTYQWFIYDLAPVPEPTTWALMILGFGAMGSAIRRRRGAVAAY